MKKIRETSLLHYTSKPAPGASSIDPGLPVAAKGQPAKSHRKKNEPGRKDVGERGGERERETAFFFAFSSRCAFGRAITERSSC